MAATKRIVHTYLNRTFFADFTKFHLGVVFLQVYAEMYVLYCTLYSVHRKW